jgi:hypothetical protein
MNKLLTLTKRLPIAALSLSLSLSLLLSSCSGRRDDGTTTIAGIIYLALAVFAVISLIKQDWTIGKKIIWGLVIWFFPFLGSIIYFLFSGRK